MRSMPKDPPYRNQKLRDLAKECPHCMYCGKANDGDVVLAHSNRQRDGKGLGIKSHDMPCFVCKRCHDAIDRRSGTSMWAGDEREFIRLEAVYYSTLWLLKEGHLVTSDSL